MSEHSLRASPPRIRHKCAKPASPSNGPTLGNHKASPGCLGRTLPINPQKPHVVVPRSPLFFLRLFAATQKSPSRFPFSRPLNSRQRLFNWTGRGVGPKSAFLPLRRPVCAPQAPLRVTFLGEGG